MRPAVVVARPSKPTLEEEEVEEEEDQVVNSMRERERERERSDSLAKSARAIASEWHIAAH